MERPSRAGPSELDTAANVCAKLAGASLLWPVAALAVAVARLAPMEGVMLVLFALVPALLGMACFFVASSYFRAQARNARDTSGTGMGVFFSIGGAAVWCYCFQFIATFH